MSFFFNDIFGGGMPGGGFHGHGRGDDSDEEEVDTEKFYTVLGISKSATQDEIKKAYRKKAKTLHPDRHPGEHEKYQALFQEVQAAHEVLKDPNKRALYDKGGEKAVKQGSAGGGRGAGGLFEQMFNQGGGRGRESGPKKSPGIKVAVDVTLHDIYCGSTKKITIPRRVAGSDSAVCPRCHGSGTVTQMRRMGPMVLQQRGECPQCGGIGYKLKSERHEIEFHVPIGGRHGENVTISGEGHQYPDLAPGDVILQLRLEKHEIFKRQGADLGMTHTLSLRQALCGYKFKVPHVSGRSLVVTPTEDDIAEGAVVQPGSLKVVHTKGMPQRFNPHIKGHLYIVMEVLMPSPRTLGKGAVEIFKAILPEQPEVGGEESGDEKEQSAQSAQSGNSSSTSTSDNKNSKSQAQRKNSGGRQNNKRKGSGGNKGKGNQRNRGKGKGKGKGKKNKGGMFSGLQGAFGAENNGQRKGKNKEKEKMEEDERVSEDEMIEEVECHSVDGNPKATPASASNYYQDDDQDEEGVQCRQM